MRKFFFILVIALLCAGAYSASAQMSDDAIVEYVATGMASGKSQNQIASELVAKGVSSTQLKRVLSMYKAQINASATQQESDIESTRNKRSSNSRNENSAISQLRQGTNVYEEEYEEEYEDEDSEGDAQKDGEKSSKKKKIKIYGHDIFNNRNLSFEPNDNAATPDSYVLGPGDEIIIDVWGENEASIKQTISPEGDIMVSQIGPIQLAGLTLDAARTRIKKAFSKKYAALGGSASQVAITLSRNRTIQVNVMGEVTVPGTYRMSSFSTVFNALHMAGGITRVGSVRDVKVSRGGGIIAVVDIYQYLFEGFAASDIPLKDGDVIIVPAYNSLVNVKGKVKRPMFYEMKTGETLSDAIRYAGGFAGDAYKGDISVIRQTGAEQTVCSVVSDKFGSFVMMDGDEFEVIPAQERFKNRLEVKGAVKRAGVYQYGDDVKTVGQLINRAGGLSEDAFTGRAQIVREKDDLSLEVVAVSLAGIINGSAPDVLLKGNDVLYVSSINELEEKGDYTINGYVVNPGEYPYADHTSVEDLILLAGGLVDGASSVRVDVSRRIYDPNGTTIPEKLAEVFTFSIKDGLMADGTPDFELKPFDIVSVRRSPSYTEQKVVNIVGEVAFPGQYTLQSNEERVSDLLKRAGGAARFANLHGAILTRKLTDFERNTQETTLNVAKQTISEKEDTTKLENIKIKETYNIGLELDKAVENPGSAFDVILRDGDEITIPEMPSTVRISGDVLHPNTVAFIQGKPISYYVKQAGGYGDRARSLKTYIVYMNGSVDSGLGARVEPGCEIVVPSKPERREVTAGEIVSLGSSTASFAAVVLSIINMIKR